MRGANESARCPDKYKTFRSAFIHKRGGVTEQPRRPASLIPEIRVGYSARAAIILMEIEPHGASRSFLRGLRRGMRDLERERVSLSLCAREGEGKKSEQCFFIPCIFFFYFFRTFSTYIHFFFRVFCRSRLSRGSGGESSTSRFTRSFSRGNDETVGSSLSRCTCFFLFQCNFCTFFFVLVYFFVPLFVFFFLFSGERKKGKVIGLLMNETV